VIKRVQDEEKMAGKPVVDSEERFEDFCDEANDMMQSVSPDGRLRWVNKAWLRKVRYSKRETANMTVMDIIHPDELEHCQQLFKRVMSGEDVGRITTAFVAKDGNTIFVEGEVNCKFAQGKPVYTRAIFRDITERVQAESMFKSAAVASPIGMYIVQDGKFCFTNARFQEYTGYTEDELLGTDSLSLVAPNDSDRVRETAIRMLKGEAVAPYEFQVLTKSGETAWVLETVASIEFHGARAVVGNFVDITERRKAEEELQRLYALERGMRHELEAERKKRIEFTRALVHELKTPLTPVLAAAELLLQKTKDESSLKLVKSLERSASNLNRRVDDFMDLIRGETDMLSLDLAPLNPVSLLEDVAQEMTPVAANAGRFLATDLPSSAPDIQADSDRLRQVVQNLLNNAIKYSPSGGTITLSAMVDGTSLVVEVHDSGHGIPKNDLGRLFDPYFRRVQDRSRLGGLGLGLALSKKLVELHGGEMWVTSGRGKGTTFSFSLPLEYTS